MARNDLIDLTAVEARDRMVAGDLSAEAYTQACLDQIAARDGAVEAWVHLDPDYALAQARAADQQRASGAGIGALHGLPVGIKDIIDTADMPTQNGCAIFKNHQPARDATCVAALRAAGAIILGKTVTTELASITPNKTKNPHNPAYTPGGSSSGSAAGVAAKMMPLALGTQTGGSVIRPGSFNGVHALKPTLGLISRTGVTMQSNTLDTVGVYGRSLADLALITDALSQYDPTDAVSFSRTRASLSAASAVGVGAKPVFAFVKSPAWDVAEAAAQAALEALLARFGTSVTELEIPALAPIMRHQASVMGAENAHFYGPLLARQPDGLSPGLAERLKAGATVPGHDYVAALQARETIYAEVDKVLSQFTALVTLSSCGPAPLGLGSTGNPAFNGMWTLLGVPCVSLPLMQVGGMPCGVQLIGKRRDEGRLLAAARWFEGVARSHAA